MTQTRPTAGGRPSESYRWQRRRDQSADRKLKKAELRKKLSPHSILRAVAFKMVLNHVDTAPALHGATSRAELVALFGADRSYAAYQGTKECTKRRPSFGKGAP